MTGERNIEQRVSQATTPKILAKPSTFLAPTTIYTTQRTAVTVTLVIIPIGARIFSIRARCSESFSMSMLTASPRMRADSFANLYTVYASIRHWAVHLFFRRTYVLEIRILHVTELRRCLANMDHSTITVQLFHVPSMTA
jgi:hypothetical protein